MTATDSRQGRVVGNMTLRIIDAMTLRDGGTTCVTVEDGGDVIHITAEHRMRMLPWLPWPRFVYTSSERFGMDRRLIPGGGVERRYVSQIAHAAADVVGMDEMRLFLLGQRPNPGSNQWYYVLNFLHILDHARLRRVL